MSTGAFTMVGNPGETEETIDETRKFLNTVSLTDHPSTSILYVLPGTMLYEDLKKRAYIDDSDWVKHDSVPLYSIDNPYRTLYKWRTVVENSGNRISFKPDKHFWYLAIAASGLVHFRILFLRYIWYVKKVLSRIKLYLFNSKGRLSW